jgi:hypothetical protein
MKNLIYLVIVVFFHTSCTKDKTTLSVIDNSCSDTISFSNQILPMVQTYCISCHDYGNSTGYILTNHANISANATLVYNSLLGTSVQLMPKDGPAINDSLIKQFSCWINQGKQNN